MNDPFADDPVFQRMRAAWQDPRFQKAFAEIKALVGYELPLQQRAPFLLFHSFITGDPVPKYITTWRSDAKLNRWYERHVNGILCHVQNALGCVWYHRENIQRIEESVREAFLLSGAQLAIGDSTIGLGNTVRWDAEYQSFVLSARRCLDYLARALGTYFQRDVNSFRRLPQQLGDGRPDIVRQAILAAHARHVGSFDYVLSDGENKSVRDLLSHYKYIGAGCLNLSNRGFLMAGGGEKTEPRGTAWDGGLSAAINKRADDLHRCIADVLTAFTMAARAHDGQLGA